MPRKLICSFKNNWSHFLTFMLFLERLSATPVLQTFTDSQRSTSSRDPQIPMCSNDCPVSNHFSEKQTMKKPLVFFEPRFCTTHHPRTFYSHQFPIVRVHQLVWKCIQARKKVAQHFGLVEAVAHPLFVFFYHFNSLMNSAADDFCRLIAVGLKACALTADLKSAGKFKRSMIGF